MFREQMRQAMNEPWRTLIGHLRHESGHVICTDILDVALRQTPQVECLRDKLIFRNPIAMQIEKTTAAVTQPLYAGWGLV